jgi:DNA-binding protein HU-beta
VVLSELGVALDRRFRDCYKGHPGSSPAASPKKYHQLRKGIFVNKSELIDAIAKHADISKAAAGRALDATVNSIKGSLKKGDVVTLVGFGSFYVGKRTARQGRNPRTGATIKIKAAKVPKFRAGKELKDSVN